MIGYLISMTRNIYSIDKDDINLLLLYCYFLEKLKIMCRGNEALYSTKYAMRTFSFVSKCTRGTW